MNKHSNLLRIAIAIAIFIAAGSNCVYHGTVSSEWEYIIPQAPERSDRAGARNDSQPTQANERND